MLGNTPRRSAILFELLVVNQKVVNGRYGITRAQNDTEDTGKQMAEFCSLFIFLILIIAILYFHIYLKKSRDGS